MEHTNLEKIYQMYYHDVYLYAFSLCKDAAEAEYLTSDTFYKALLSLKDAGPPVKYWLLRVCKNLFLDDLRKKKKRGVHSLEENAPLSRSASTGTHGTPEVLDSILDQMIKREDAKTLYRCILLLPQRDMEYIYMFYFMNYSIKEIAQFSSVPPGAVKTALSRARTKLKRLLLAEDSQLKTQSQPAEGSQLKAQLQPGKRLPRKDEGQEVQDEI